MPNFKNQKSNQIFMPVAKSQLTRHVSIFNLLEESWTSFTLNAAQTLRTINKMETLAKKVSDRNFIALVKIEKANYLTSFKGDYPDSLNLLEEAYTLLDSEFKKQYAGIYHLCIAKNYHQLAVNERAQHHYHAAIKSLESKKNKKDYEKKWLGMAYYNLYTLFSYTDPDFSQYEYLQKAMEIYREINYSSGLSNCYNSMARIYFNKQDYETTLEYLTTSQKLLEEINDTTILATLYSNIGLTYAKAGKAKEGIKYVKKGMALAVIQKNNLRIVHAYEKMGEIFLQTGEYLNAVENLKIAEEKAVEIHAKKYLSGIYKNMVEAFEKLEDYKSAHEYDLKYIEIVLDNFKAEKSQAILKARNQFELEKKELETLLLKEKNKQVENYASKLKAYYDELSQFTYVTSHHLREPLRTITSYVTLLERSLKDKVDADEKEFMNYISGATSTMYNLLGGLITFSNIDVAASAVTTNINQVLTGIMNDLRTELKNKNAAINCDDMPTLYGSPAHYKILFRNLISNALIYNHSPAPKVEIIYRNEYAQHHIIVSDNGIGIETQYSDKIFMIFERLHPKNEFSGTGIGLAICKKIVEQLDGKIWVEQNSAGGSDFHITFPEK